MPAIIIAITPITIVKAKSQPAIFCNKFKVSFKLPGPPPGTPTGFRTPKIILEQNLSASEITPVKSLKQIVYSFIVEELQQSDTNILQASKQELSIASNILQTLSPPALHPGKISA